MKICKFCKKEYQTIWSKCENCLDGSVIYHHGVACFICEETRIHPSELYKGTCNRCYSSSINKSSPDNLNDNSV